jgi:hypothetical protein
MAALICTGVLTATHASKLLSIGVRTSIPFGLSVGGSRSNALKMAWTSVL